MVRLEFRKPAIMVHDAYFGALLSTCVRLSLRDAPRIPHRYPCDDADLTPEWLAQDTEDLASELRPFSQEENTVGRQRHFTRHPHWPPPINLTSEVAWRRAKPVCHDQRLAVAGDEVVPEWLE
jgi:hypothetical protein